MEAAKNVSTLPTAQAPAAFDLSPRTLAEAMEFAAMMAKSTIVPKDYIDKPGNILVAVQWGMEVGLKPLQAMQNIAVINGRPSIWGDSLIAIVLASPLCEYIREGESNDQQGVCRVKRRGQPEEVRIFTRKDAEQAHLLTKDGPWKQYTKRMMQMRARAWALRDVFPDVLRGMAIAEEVMDGQNPKDVTAEGATLPPGSPEPAKQTRTGTLVERLKGEKAPSVGDVVTAFDDARDAEAIAAAVELAKKLKTDEAKKAANEAYHRAVARMRAAEKGVDTATGEVVDTRTDEQILAEIAAAKSGDELDVLADGLRAIDATRRDLLLQHVQKRRAALA